MQIELHEITVKELAKDYIDNNEEGIVGFGGKLDIRPPYQREFIYKDKQRDAVINTLIKGFPLNIMYWSVKNDGNYEIIDGQQRTVSICQYIIGDFSFEQRYFHNLKDDEKDNILNYKVMVYFCSGTDSEKLDWFRTINIAGEKLSDQELRNAVYSGSWVTDAKRYFSKTGCVASQMASDYLTGSAIRQQYLETAIRWISKNNIEEYMATHQHDPNAGALWRYFSSVISWIESTFKVKRKKYMAGVDWGYLYNKYHDKVLNQNKIEEETAKLMKDDDVTKKSGIYPYILTKQEKYLSIRAFTDSQKASIYEKQKGICPSCKEHFEIEEMEADHITPWCEGGKTIPENLQMLCKECNRRKSNK